MKISDKRRQRGFTLLELLNVMLLVSILALIAIPKFMNLRDQALEARGWGNIGALRAASYIFYAISAMSGAPHFPETNEELEDYILWDLEWEDGGGYEMGEL